MKSLMCTFNLLENRIVSNNLIELTFALDLITESKHSILKVSDAVHPLQIIKLIYFCMKGSIQYQFRDFCIIQHWHLASRAQWRTLKQYNGSAPRI